MAKRFFMVPNKKERPLVVDLDGTLVKTDTLLESVLLLIKKEPWALASFPKWLIQGRANFKSEVAERVELEVEFLPYHKSLLRYLRQQQQKGRQLVLATASNNKVAQAVADYVNIFTRVIASDRSNNLSGYKKAEELSSSYSVKGFDYVGNSRSDVAVWSKAKEALIVSDNMPLIRRVGRILRIERIFKGQSISWSIAMREMRIYQWVKNILVFVPMLAAQAVGDGQVVMKSGIAFISFSMAASAVYVFNDLFDLSVDRRDPIKKNRPIASGKMSVGAAFILGVLLLVIAVGLTWWLPLLFVYLLLVYLVLNLTYSIRFRRIVLVDVVLLASFYTVRVLAGGAATGVPVSEWLLAWIAFLSLSGALAKRYLELDRLSIKQPGSYGGRGYLTSDKQIVGQLGLMSSYLALLILALYINSQEVTAYYSKPAVLWFVVMLLWYWLSRMWLFAYRKVVKGDPIAFMIKDRVSYWVLGLVVVVVLIAI